LWPTQCLPHPWSQDGEQCIPLHRGCCQPGRCPADGQWNALLTILAEDDPPLYKLGSKPVQAVCKGESGALNWVFLGGAREQTFGSNAPPTGTLFSVEEFIVYGHYRAKDHIHCNLRRSAITQIVWGLTLWSGVALWYGIGTPELRTTCSGNLSN